jgi:hypothetical protein
VGEHVADVQEEDRDLAGKPGAGGNVGDRRGQGGPDLGEDSQRVPHRSPSLEDGAAGPRLGDAGAEADMECSHQMQKVEVETGGKELKKGRVEGNEDVGLP